MKAWVIIILALFLFGCAAENRPGQIQPGQEIIIEETGQEERPALGEPLLPESPSEIIAGAKTPYIRYSKAGFEKAKQDGKVIYLYFYATWCPICRADRPGILAAFEEMSFENVVGFEVHFNDGETNDEDEALAKEMGVRYQHTTVILDKEGNAAYRSLSGIEKETILAEIAKLV